MKTPAWFRARLADLGPLVQQEDLTEDEAADRIAEIALREDKTFVLGIVREFTLKKLAVWLGSHQPSISVPRDDGQTDLFPNLPRRLETSPGRFAALAVMTGHDWDTALKCAEAKEMNASGYAEKVRAAHGQVRPLLTDDSMTTADVWPNREPMALFGSGS